MNRFRYSHAIHHVAPTNARPATWNDVLELSTEQHRHRQPVLWGTSHQAQYLASLGHNTEPPCLNRLEHKQPLEEVSHKYGVCFRQHPPVSHEEL